MLKSQHLPESYSAWQLLDKLAQHQQLIFSLIRREVQARYQGSLLGLFWAIANPVFMLTVYTFVFSVVFKARWNTASESKTEFALVLFIGMAIFGIFSECLSKAPASITANTNYVKKVVFPLEIIAIVNLGAACFHFALSFLVWLVFYLLCFGVPPATAWQLPFALLPLLTLSLGFSWFFSALGVYLRDIQQVVSVLIVVLSFLSPIYYPLQALPVEFRAVLAWSPLALIIEQSRNLLIWGKPVDWMACLILNLVCAGLAWLGYVWFQKTRKGFADVL